MSVVAITSSRTSPGATTLAAGLATAWSHTCEHALLVEADPAGGVLSLRFDLAAAPSLATFGSDIRNGYSTDLLWSNTQDLRGVRCLTAPVDPRVAGSWVERIAPDLVEHLPTLGSPTVIDLGCLGDDGASVPLAAAADTTLVVTAPQTAEVQAMLFQIRQLQRVGANVALVVVGDQPHDPQEIADLAGVPLAAVLPVDRGAAAALAGAKFSPKKFRRSLLWRTISGLAAALLDEHLMHSRRTDLPDGDAANLAFPLHEPMPEPVAAPAESAPLHEPILPPMPAAGRVAADLSEPAVMGDEPSPIEPLVWRAPEPEASHVASSAAEQPLAQPSAPAVASDINLSFDYEPTVRMQRQLVLSNGDRHVVPTGQPVTIGRSTSCDVVITDKQVSRHHGTLTYTSGGWEYTDNNSRNGSLVNGDRCVAATLCDNDELVVGRTTISFARLAAVPTTH